MRRAPHLEKETYTKSLEWRKLSSLQIMTDRFVKMYPVKGNLCPEPLNEHK